MQYATVDGVKKGFQAASDRMDSIEKSLQDLNVGLSEFADAFKDINNKLKLYGRSVLNASERAGDYKGFWRDEAMAKGFGLIVLSVLRQEKKSLGTINNPSGGYLTQEEMVGWVIQKLGQYGKFRRNAMIVPMGNGKLSVPRITTDLTVYCPEEGGEISWQKRRMKSLLSVTGHRHISTIKVSSAPCWPLTL
jgi:HK97 family phage major capsid protein